MSAISRKIKQNMMKYYGHMSDPTKTRNHNAYNYLEQMPAWHYFTRPTNIAFHDLTKEKNSKHYIKSC